jgi:hypothetical protein
MAAEVAWSGVESTVKPSSDVPLVIPAGKLTPVGLVSWIRVTFVAMARDQSLQE